MTDTPIAQVYEVLAERMPQTKACSHPGVSWPQNCPTCGGSCTAPVTALDLAAVDEFGRPSGWLWRLLMHVIMEGGTVDLNFYGIDRVDCDMRPNGTEYWQEGRADSQDDVAEAIARALFATLGDT